MLAAINRMNLGPDPECLGVFLLKVSPQLGQVPRSESAMGRGGRNLVQYAALLIELEREPLRIHVGGADRAIQAVSAIPEISEGKLDFWK